MNENKTTAVDRGDSSRVDDYADSQHYRAMAEFACKALDATSTNEIIKHALNAVSISLNASECYVIDSLDQGLATSLRVVPGNSESDMEERLFITGRLERSDNVQIPESQLLVNYGGEQRILDMRRLMSADDTSAAAVFIQRSGKRRYGVLGASAGKNGHLDNSSITRLGDVANILSKALDRVDVVESALHTEGKLRDLADRIPEILWCADDEGNVEYRNARWERIFGDTDPSEIRSAWLSVLHPDDRDKWLQAWSDCINRQTPFETECRINDKQANFYRWHLVRALPKQEKGGTRVLWYGSCTDIHDQKTMESSLIEHARVLDLVNWLNATLAEELGLENLAKTVIDVGMQLSGAEFGAYIQRTDNASSHAYELLALSGVLPDELGDKIVQCLTALFECALHGGKIFRSDDILADQRSRGAMQELFSATVTTPARSYMSVAVVARTGEILGGMIFGHKDVGAFDEGDERSIMGLATQASIAVDNAKLYRDLTRSKNDARWQYEQINAIYATAPIGLCFIDNDFRVVRMNESLMKLVDRKVADVRGQILSQVLGEAASCIEPICRDALETKKPILDLETSWKKSTDDSDVCWLCSCYPILDPDGQVLGVNTVIQDITERKRGELELARLGSIIENSYDAIIGKTLDGIITSWNSGAERIYGYTAEEVIGKSISMVIPPDKQQEELDVLTSLRNGKHVSLDETVRVSKNRGLIHVSSTLSPIRNRIGDVVGVSTIARDLTASKMAERKARENEERMRMILQATRIGTWDWDVNSNEVRWSENMEELHGRRAGDFRGNLDSALSDVHPEDRPMLEAAIAEALKYGGDYRSEYRILGEDGRMRWMEGKGQVIYGPDGKLSHMAGVCMDVTERMEAEEALRISETMLRAQTEELATAHHQKDQFLAMLAHELRNPLAPISNAVQLLKIQEPEQREKILHWAIDVIDRQVWLISSLVDDLLDIARITRGHIELKLQEINVLDSVRVAAESARVWFDIKNQSFEMDCPDRPIYIYADPTRMIQVISNLLNNASKFTPEYGRIALRVFVSRNDAVISVSDSGVGIAADMLPHVFELFTQADRSLDRHKGGLGLGLSLVKKLIEMHGGKVMATSPGIGRGSEFTIHLPGIKGVDDTIESSSPVVASRMAESGLRILLVDDNRQSTDAMALLLETLGHKVMSAYNGPDALHIADEFRPEIVFLDIGLPVMDGYEVAKRLRSRFCEKVSLIALTGYGPEQDQNRRSETSFDQYLLKPLSLDKLSLILDRN